MSEKKKKHLAQLAAEEAAGAAVDKLIDWLLKGGAKRIWLVVKAIGLILASAVALLTFIYFR